MSVEARTDQQRVGRRGGSWRFWGAWIGGRRILGRTLWWRTLVLAVVAAGVAGSWSASHQAFGQRGIFTPNRQSSRPLNPSQPQTYRDVLIYGLMARLPTELAYVDSVVDAVEDHKIPATLVNQTFFWARTRSGEVMYGRPNRPIIYFIPALNARIKKLGIKVDLDGGLP
jgi:hypothetical protein